MTDKEIVAKWKDMTGITSDELVGFFQAFRPQGDGLLKAFEGVTKADEILPRLLEIYQVTTDGYPEDAYFVIRKPLPLSRELALGFASSHIRKCLDIAKEMGRDDLVQLLQLYHRMEVVVGDKPWPPRQDESEVDLDEVVIDFMLSLKPLKSQALLLSDALYSMACDTYIRDYIFWPLFRNSTIVADPFAPYFNLWKHGAGLRLESDHLLKVYLPVGCGLSRVPE